MYKASKAPFASEERPDKWPRQCDLLFTEGDAEADPLFLEQGHDFTKFTEHIFKA